MDIRHTRVSSDHRSSLALRGGQPDQGSGASEAVRPQRRELDGALAAVTRQVPVADSGAAAATTGMAERRGFSADEAQPLLFSDEQIHEAAVNLHGHIGGEIDALISSAVASSSDPQADRTTLNEVSGVCQSLGEGVPVDVCALSPLAAAVATEVERTVSMEAARAGRPLSPEERLQAIHQAVANLHQESWAEGAQRWGRNVRAELLRTGAIVGGATVLRQYVGALAQRAMGCDLATRHRVSTLLCGLGMLQNVAGFLRDEYRGTATTASRTGRAAMMAFGGMAMGLTVAANRGALPAGGGALLAPAALQAAAYVLTRDALQAGFPLRSNNEGLDASTVEAARLAYGFNQFLGSTAMDRFPHSGFGGAARGMPDCTPNTVTPQPTIFGQTAATTVATTTNNTSATTTSNAAPLNGSVSLGSPTTSGESVGPTFTPVQADAVAPIALSDWRMLRDTIARSGINAACEIGDDLVLNATQRAAERSRAEQAFEELRRTGTVDDIVSSQTELVRRLWRSAQEHEACGVAQGLSGEALSSHVSRAVGRDMERLAGGLRLWVEPRMPSASQLADQFSTTAAARHQAFGGVYAATLVLDHLLPNTLAPEVRGALLNATVGGLLYMIYGPFAHMHETRAVLRPSAEPPVPAAQEAMQAAPADSSSLLTRRHRRTADDGPA